LVENPVGRDPSEDLGVDGSLWRRVWSWLSSGTLRREVW
jgi:hypothetical protein